MEAISKPGEKISEVERRLHDLGLTLPPPPPPMAKYNSWRIAGNHIYLAGQGPLVNGKCPEHLCGRLGKELTVENGVEAAQLSALMVLSVLKAAVGDLDKVKLIHMQGFVASTADFYRQPEVIDGASKLFKDVMGEKGDHSRVALGTNVLPFHAPLEIEVFAEILEES